MKWQFLTNLGAKIQIHFEFFTAKKVNFDTKIKIDHFSRCSRICSFWTKNGPLTHCELKSWSPKPETASRRMHPECSRPDTKRLTDKDTKQPWTFHVPQSHPYSSLLLTFSMSVPCNYDARLGSSTLASFSLLAEREIGPIFRGQNDIYQNLDF